ncbi:unnamed protein product [Phytophthora fragariaefolia]|uniref:Unnamed protein product n=1 Tax=Phytophthora fragariaefolia TaxID=1490495 RepID=A0A9W6XBG8_9STRA|nr:unnamed protein product [Phytophthora fragariaefolia]
MMAIWNIKRDCDMGDRFLEWLQSTQTNRTSIKAFKCAQTHRPNETVQWHARTGLLYSHVYRLAPGEWFNTSSFEALATVWSRYNARTIIMPPVSLQALVVPLSSVEEARESTLQWMLLPVNVGETHWTGIIIDKKKHQFIRYDSLGRHSEILDRVATVFKTDATFANYSVLNTSPVQTDSYYCGLFTAYFFWGTIDPTLDKMLSAKKRMSAHLICLGFVFKSFRI